MKYFFAFFLCACFLPCLAYADVKINEVAWMGTATSQYNEWIELYNSGDDAVPLSGWKLYKTNNIALFTLSKTIPAHGYMLVERTTASAPDAVPAINDESGTFSGGGLSNSGEDLVLKDSTDTAVDSLLFAGGWPAGDSTSKDTMQLSDGHWITAPGTPDAPNATVSEQGDDDSTDTSTDGSNDQDTVATQHTASSATSTQTTTSSSNKKQSAPIKLVVLDPELTLTADKTSFQGNAVHLTPALKNPGSVQTAQGYFYWNMGDGTTYTQSVLAPIAYTYHYAGSYTVSLSYFGSSAAAQPLLQVYFPITVLAPKFMIHAIDDGAALQISNMLTVPIDVGQWSVRMTGAIRSLPLATVIGPMDTITITKELFGVSTIENPVIVTRDGTAVTQ